MFFISLIFSKDSFETVFKTVLKVFITTSYWLNCILHAYMDIGQQIKIQIQPIKRRKRSTCTKVILRIRVQVFFFHSVSCTMCSVSYSPKKVWKISIFTSLYAIWHTFQVRKMAMLTKLANFCTTYYHFYLFPHVHLKYSYCCHI